MSGTTMRIESGASSDEHFKYYREKWCRLGWLHLGNVLRFQEKQIEDQRPNILVSEFIQQILKKN